MDGRMDGWMDGWMGWIGIRPVYVCVDIYIYTLKGEIHVLHVIKLASGFRH